MKDRETLIWPDGRRFAVCLTHDVDRVKKSYQYFTHFAKTLRPYHLISLFQKEEPYWNFEKIMEIEEKYEVRSTFFFLNETKNIDLLHPKNWALSLGKYSFSDEKIAEIMQKLHANGWEIGLHGSYDSYKNKELLAKEKKLIEDVIGDKIVGIRQHYLNLEIPHTWKIQKEVGFEYDASFGSNYEIGFREEKYLPFRPFDDQFLEIPLTIMDSTLFQNSKSISNAWAKCKELIEQAEKRGALLTVLWHQRVFNEKEFLRWSEIYEKIIQESVRRDAWITLMKDLYKYWQKEVFEEKIQYCLGSLEERRLISNQEIVGSNPTRGSSVIL